MRYKTQKNVTAAVALLFVLAQFVLVAAVIFVAIHFLSKVW